MNGDSSALSTPSPAKLRHVGVLDLPVGEVRPSPENEQLYRPVDPADPEIMALAEGMPPTGLTNGGTR